MCCSGDSTVKASEQAQAAFTNLLSSSFSQAFAANQKILAGLTDTLNGIIQNPQGFSPKTLALMKTNAAEMVTGQTGQAQTSANAYLASHGGADLGSGVAAQIKGQIASQGATEQARESNQIDIQSGLLQNQNYWNAIGGLTQVANAYNPAGYANAETNSANAVADLSRASLASQQAGWQNTFGIINGIAGLGTAAVGAYKAFGGGTASGGGGSSGY